MVMGISGKSWTTCDCQSELYQLPVNRFEFLSGAGSDGWNSFSSPAFISPPENRCLFAKTCSSSQHDNLLDTKVQFLWTLLNCANQCEPAEARRHWDHWLLGGFRQRCPRSPSFHPAHNHPGGSRHLLCLWNCRRL